MDPEQDLASAEPEAWDEPVPFVEPSQRFLHRFISETLFEADPIRINYEDNTDEYDGEARTILARLPQATCAGDVETIAHEEFCKWFSPSTAGPPERYHALAGRIWAEWQRRPMAVS